MTVTHLYKGSQLKAENGLILNLISISSFKYFLVWEDEGKLEGANYMKETVLEMINEGKWKIMLGKNRVKYYTK